MKLLEKNESEHTVTGLVLIPEVADSQGDIISASEIASAQELWSEKYRHLALKHADIDGVPFPMASGILAPDDPAFLSYKDEFSILSNYIAPQTLIINKQEVPVGSWILKIRVNDESIWQDVVQKRLSGFSIGGHGIGVPITEN